LRRWPDSFSTRKATVNARKIMKQLAVRTAPSATIRATGRLPRENFQVRGE
jgi:hypothetical protein